MASADDRHPADNRHPEACPACGGQEVVVIKKERMPSGKTKLIQKCKKCGKIFETITTEE
jgi:uncharacterized Zn finger protein